MRSNCAVVALWVLTATVAGAATLHVPSEYPTIQAGVDSASVGDTVLVAPNTYSGTGNTDVQFWGKDIALVSSSGPALTVIDCWSQARGFKLLDGVSRDALIEGFTVLDGFAQFGGGGAYFRGSSPTVRNCVFSNCFVEGEFEGQCSPAFGGAVYIAFWSDPLFTNCSFVGNEIFGEPSYGTDVTIYNSAVTLQNCLFAYGTDDGELYGNALGVDAGGPNFTIERCLFTDSAGYPGYVHVADPGLCDWYPGSQLGFQLCSDSPALPDNNEWSQLVGALGAGCGPCVTAVENSSWGGIKALYR